MFSKKRYILYWIIIGIYISWAIAAIIKTPYGSTDDFFDVGYRESYINILSEGALASDVYSLKTGEFEFTESSDPVEAGCVVTRPEETDINYIYADIDIVSDGDVPLYVACQTEGEDVKYITLRLNSGAAYYEIPTGYDTYRLFFKGDGSYRFKLNALDVSEYDYDVGIRRVIPTFGIVLAFYLVITAAVIILLKKKKIISSETFLHVSVFERFDKIGSRFDGIRLRGNWNNYLRSLLFCFVYAVWRTNIALPYIFVVAMTFIGFFGIILLIPRERPIGNRRASCLEGLLMVLLTAELIADIVAPKMYGYTEIWMGLIFVCLGYFWMRMDDPSQLMLDFLRGLNILFIVSVSYALIEYYTYTEMKYFRISGFWDNPNPFSISLATYVGCALVYIYLSHSKLWWKLVLFAFCGLGLWEIYISQCRTALLIAVANALLLIGFIIYQKTPAQHRPKLLIAAVIGCVLFVGAFFMVLKGFSGRTVNEIDSSNGRFQIWTNYFKSMNLFGHEAYGLWYGKSVYSHNFVIREHFKYGWICGALFVLALIEYIFGIITNFLRAKDKTVIAVIVTAFAYGFGGFLESAADMPMLWTNWYAFYILLLYFVVTL